MDAFELTPLKSKMGKWILALAPGTARLEPVESGAPVLVSRDEVPEKLEVSPIWGGQGVLVVRPGAKKKLEFRLSREQRQKVSDWLGSPTRKELIAALRRRYLLAVPISLLFMFVSLPVTEDLAHGIEAAPFDPIYFVLGAGLLCFWIAYKLRPTRNLFALDAVWFALLAFASARDVYLGQGNTPWVIWPAVLLWLAWLGIRQFRRFADCRQTAAAAGPS